MRPEPIILVMPEGLSPSQMTEVSRQCAALHTLTGHTFVALPAGATRAPQRIEHDFGLTADEAITALPRIAEALERLVEIFKEAR